jgi:hypothetical protein
MVHFILIKLRLNGLSTSLGADKLGILRVLVVLCGLD